MRVAWCIREKVKTVAIRRKDRVTTSVFVNSENVTPFRKRVDVLIINLYMATRISSACKICPVLIDFLKAGSIRIDFVNDPFALLATLLRQHRRAYRQHPGRVR